MYFVRSGYIDLMYAALKGSGFASYLWSATAYAPELSDAFTFRFNATTINSSNSNGRFNAFSLPVLWLPYVFRP